MPDCTWTRLDPETITCDRCGREMSWGGALDLKRNCLRVVEQVPVVVVQAPVEVTVDNINSDLPAPPKAPRPGKKGCGCGRSIAPASQKL